MDDHKKRYQIKSNIALKIQLCICDEHYTHSNKNIYSQYLSQKYLDKSIGKMGEVKWEVNIL